MLGSILLSHSAVSTLTSGLRCLEEAGCLTQLTQPPQVDSGLGESCCLTQLPQLPQVGYVFGRFMLSFSQLSQLPQVDLGLEGSCYLTQLPQLPQVDLDVWKNHAVSLSCLNFHKWRAMESSGE